MLIEGRYSMNLRRTLKISTRAIEHWQVSRRSWMPRYYTQPGSSSRTGSLRPHVEWIAALLRNRPDLDRQRLQRTRDLMDSHVRDCIVEGFSASTVAGSHTASARNRWLRWHGCRQCLANPVPYESSQAARNSSRHRLVSSGASCCSQWPTAGITVRRRRSA